MGVVLRAARREQNQPARGNALRSRGQATIAASAHEDRSTIPELHLAFVLRCGVAVDLVAGADGTHEDRGTISELHLAFVPRCGVAIDLVAGADGTHEDRGTIPELHVA